MAEFEVAGHRYASRKLDAFTQFHVVRKLAPAVAPLVSAAQPMLAAYVAAKASGEGAAGSLADVGALLDNLEPLLKVLADLPADDCDFVLGTCLSAVTRADDKGGGWSPVWNAAAKRMMFDDIDMPSMLAIAGHVIKADLAGFTDALRRNLNGGAR